MFKIHAAEIGNVGISPISIELIGLRICFFSLLFNNISGKFHYRSKNIELKCLKWTFSGYPDWSARALGKTNSTKWSTFVIYSRNSVFFCLLLLVTIHSNDFFSRVAFHIYFCWTWHLFFIGRRFILSQNLSHSSALLSFAAASLLLLLRQNKSKKWLNLLRFFLGLISKNSENRWRARLLQRSWKSWTLIQDLNKKRREEKLKCKRNRSQYVLYVIRLIFLIIKKLQSLLWIS